MSQQKIGAQQLAKAAEQLRRYKQAKANLERRIVENEQWYKMRYTDAVSYTHLDVYKRQRLHFDTKAQP